MISLSRRLFLAGAATTVSLKRAAAEGPALKLIFPFAAGGAADAILRDISERLRVTLNRPVVVENRTGAGGRIGAVAVKDAAPDGNTLLVAAGAQMFLQPHAFSNLGYDPAKDFVPVSQLMTFSQAAAIGASLPVRSLGELAPWLAADPAHAAFGSPGAGTGAHFAGLAFGRLAGLDMRHVAYRGMPAALPDLIAGRLPLCFASASEFAEQHRAGTIRLLAVLDPQRSPLMPDIATFKESGYDLVAPGWFGVHAPAKTPAAIIARLEAAFIAAIAKESVRQRMQDRGFVPTGTDAATLDKVQVAQFKRWGTVVAASGFKGEL